MNIKKILLTTILASSAFATQDPWENFCPISRVVIEILQNCKDTPSCKQSCHMMYNIALASGSESGFEETLDGFGIDNTYCDSIEDANVNVFKAWSNAIIETAEYHRTLQNC